MSDAAAVVQRLAVVEFPERAGALGTGERGRRPELLDTLHAVVVRPRLLRCLERHLRVRRGGVVRLADQLHDQRGDVGARHHEVHRDARDRVLRHARDGRFRRILHDGNAARLLDLLEADRAVVQRAAQDDADDARTEMVRGRAEQRVDGRAQRVLVRPAPDLDPAAAQVRLQARGSDVNSPAADWLVVHGVGGGELPGSVENRGQHARLVGPDVQHDEHRGRERLRQRLRDRRQHGDAAR